MPYYNIVLIQTEEAFDKEEEKVHELFVEIAKMPVSLIFAVNTEETQGKVNYMTRILKHKNYLKKIDEACRDNLTVAVMPDY